MKDDTKELVIEARIPLPDDYMEGVEIAARAKPAADAFRDSLANALVDIPHRVTTMVMMPKPPKKTRAPRSDAGHRRKRESSAPAYGTDEQPGV